LREIRSCGAYVKRVVVKIKIPINLKGKKKKQILIFIIVEVVQLEAAQSLIRKEKFKFLTIDSMISTIEGSKDLNT